jgi:tetratricopeptide (TPR) repeat protein
MKRTILLLTLAAIFALNVECQEFNAIQEAFTKSYSLENDKKYSEAAESLLKVYIASSYELNLRLGWLTYLTGEFTKSLDYYQKAIDLQPYAIEPKFGYIMPASMAGNWSQVEEQYKKILVIDPMNTKANYWLGMIYYNREQYQDAMKCFEKVVNLYPYDYDATIMFAWSNLKVQNLREAKALFQKALIIRPGDSSAQEGLDTVH